MQGDATLAALHRGSERSIYRAFGRHRTRGEKAPFVSCFGFWSIGKSRALSKLTHAVHLMEGSQLNRAVVILLSG